MAKEKKEQKNKEEELHVDQMDDQQAAVDVEENQETDDERTEEEKLQEQLNLEKDKFLRLFAEFENFKRRTAKERIELYKTAGEGILKDMLPVLDDFDRGMVEINKCDDDQMKTGVNLIANKLRSTLTSKGLEEIKVENGEKFDADKHDAVTQIPAPDESMKGSIIEVIEKGYKLGDKIIRHPKVVVGK
ncbi:MAG: nucleotide exchange factor GrpE [Nonlabens sp.]